MRTKITVNGREYDSLEQMPPETRRLYQDALQRLGPDRDGNGIPDRIEAQGAGGPRAIVENQIVLNGESYSSVEEMPAHVRLLYENAMKRVRRGPGLGAEVTKEGFEASLAFGRREPAPGAGDRVPGAPRFDSATIESGIRTALFVIACGVVAAVVLLVLLGRR